MLHRLPRFIQLLTAWVLVLPIFLRAKKEYIQVTTWDNDGYNMTQHNVYIRAFNDIEPITTSGVQECDKQLVNMLTGYEVTLSHTCWGCMNDQDNCVCTNPHEE
jgi:hypothetical protein